MQDPWPEDVVLNISRTSLRHSWKYSSAIKPDHQKHWFRHCPLVETSFFAGNTSQYIIMSDQQQAPADHQHAPADQKQVPADANVGWEEMKSQKGEKYRVKADDYDIAAKPTDEEADATAANGPSFDDVSVYWTVGTSGAPSLDVQNKTAITWYKLEYAEWYSYFKYKLTFSCIDKYNYKFKDQEPDTYACNVWQNPGTHSVEYDSKAPTIVSISGN